MKFKDARILIFDLETTGLDPVNDKVVEYAYVFCDVNGDVINYPNSGTKISFKRFCDPGFPIPPKASAIHHITDEMVKLKEPFVGYEFFDNNIDALCGHNIVGFDNKFLDKHEYPMLDTMLLAKKVWPELESYSNQYIRYFKKTYLQDNVGRQAHDALSDITVTRFILKELVKDMFHVERFAGRNPDEIELEEVIAWTMEPNILKTCRFGKKHYGTLWADVPQDYLEWMLKNVPDLDADTQLTVEHHLKQGKLFR